MKPFETRVAVGIGSTAARLGPFAIAPAMGWRGRVLDALAAPIDGLGPVEAGPRAVPVEAAPPPAMRRALVRTPVRTGVRVIDCFTPLCAGQRIGVFAGSGVGKSTLLAMLARAGGFDTVVIGLVGERGREVRDFLQAIPAAAQAAVATVVATGDESPMMRRLAPKTAMTVAEFFRDEGHSVLLIVDSITRYAHAAREVALAAGEPAVARGYAPSVFTELPRLLSAPGPVRTAAAPSRGSSRCSSMGTTTMTRSPTRSAARSTATSCWSARSPTRAATRPSTCSPRCRGLPTTSGAPTSARPCSGCAPASRATRTRATSA